jgi:hypothetical protein
MQAFAEILLSGGAHGRTPTITREGGTPEDGNLEMKKDDKLSLLLQAGA